MAEWVKSSQEMGISVFVLLFILISKVACKDVDTISIVVDKKNPADQVSIQIINPPVTIDSLTLLTVEYRCVENSIVGVDLPIAIAEVNRTSVLPRRFWRCKPTKDGQPRKRRVRLRIPDAISFRPNIYNKIYYQVYPPKLRAWITTETLFKQASDASKLYITAATKVSYKTNIPNPFSRRYKRPWKACSVWYWKIVSRKKEYERSLKCKKENEVVRMVTYPAVLNGRPYGISRSFEPYTTPILEHKRLGSFNSPQFTISMWLYILEYCPYSKQPVGHQFCSIFMHADWNYSKTPNIFVLPDGTFQIEVTFNDHSNTALKPQFVLPKHQWFRLTLSFMTRSWLLTIDYGPKWNQTFTTHYVYKKDVFLDDTTGLFIIGGNDNTMPGVLGYVGDAIFYRRKYVLPNQIPMPNPYHPMFELGLTHREEKCSNFITWIHGRVEHYRRLAKLTRRNGVCFNYFNEILRKINGSKLDNKCPIEKRPRKRLYRIVEMFIKRTVLHGRTVSHNNMSSVAEQLLNNATYLIESGLTKVPRAVPLLKQSACLGNTDAMYMLAVILNNGVYIKADEIQAQAYLMLASLEGDRLSSMALGHKHFYGIDGVSLDKDQAYMYYKFVADKTRDDIEAHRDTNVLTESVRLTDEASLKQQTDEDGDVFLWLKHQAQAGVVSAQRTVARTLFWGSQGLKRNIDAAMSYFKEGAASKDPGAMYEYGILLYKGAGKNQNKTEGKKIMEQAAAQKHPDALTALGWIAMNTERNYTKAAKYFEEAYKKSSVDSGYYIGFMYMHGMVPNQKRNIDKAKLFFSWAAQRGHVDSGVWLALISIKGTNVNKRNVNMAAEWARHIAEKNPALGYILHKALHKYRQLDLPLSLFYYMMAADTGVEVGSFNVAFLCEENKEGMSHLIEKECQWRHYNLTTLREIQFVSSYSLIKMGDYYWFGCDSRRDPLKAAGYYGAAAAKGDPHALFNIALMVEEGETIPNTVWASARVSKNDRKDNITLLTSLYTRCKESRKAEAYLPCTIALYRVQVMDFWMRYHIWMKLSTIVGVFVFTTTTMYALAHHFRHRRHFEDTV